MKRLDDVEDESLKRKVVYALGGFVVPNLNTRILFCRDTFDYPELEGHELLCNHLAPKLKGRPRGKRKKRSLSPGSESNESECSNSNAISLPKVRAQTLHCVVVLVVVSKKRNTVRLSTVSFQNKIFSEGALNGHRGEPSISTRRSARFIETNESKVFMKKLTTYMKTYHKPISRIPSLGCKECQYLDSCLYILMNLQIF